MASNYDMPKLILGQVIAVAALIFAISVICATSEDGVEPFIPLIVITLGYGAMMFASSYVEEEHHFWYWSSTTWLTFVGLRGMNKFVYMLPFADGLLTTYQAHQVQDKSYDIPRRRFSSL